MNEFLYKQLEQEYAIKIEQGYWQPGDRLPSVRSLCQQRSLSKATVLHAYGRLEARGLIEARAKSGYFVTNSFKNNNIVENSNPDSVPSPVTVTEVIRDIMSQSAAFDLLPNSDQKVDTPASIIALNRCIARALRHQRGYAHQYYDEPLGSSLLREQISRRYQRLGCLLRPEQLAITAGCQQALFLALMSCCQPGDVVAIESPGFYGALQLAEALELQVLEIPCSVEHGLDVESLAAALQNWSIKACIVTPAFATPSGSLMPQVARARLLSLADEHDFAVIEDDIYGDLTMDQRPAPLKSLDHADRVILCGSISKSLSRDLRVGWVAGGRWHEQIARLKLVNMLASSRFIEQGVASFIEDGGYDRHLKRTQLLLQEQRDQLIEVLEYNWKTPVSYHIPKGGLSLWVQLPDRIDTLEVYLKAKKQGIVITPGSLFSSQQRYSNFMRISFSHTWNTKRREALIMLDQLLTNTS